jgi:hypothetical protein
VECPPPPTNCSLLSQLKSTCACINPNLPMVQKRVVGCVLKARAHKAPREIIEGQKRGRRTCIPRVEAQQARPCCQEGGPRLLPRPHYQRPHRQWYSATSTPVSTVASDSSTKEEGKTTRQQTNKQTINKTRLSKVLYKYV